MDRHVLAAGRMRSRSSRLVAATGHMPVAACAGLLRVGPMQPAGQHRPHGPVIRRTCSVSSVCVAVGVCTLAAALALPGD
jgi:hypothetical protein